MRSPLVVVLATLAACSDSKPASEPRPEPVPIVTLPSDAGLVHPVPGVDPSGMHVDDDTTARPVQPQPLPNRERRLIDVTLRSTPPGAEVAVDGTAVGNTPPFWNGYADGREHEFVFTLRGYAIARYRFVPITSGVIHARLEPIGEERDAGVPPPEVVPNPKASITPPPPPPTVVKPVEPAPAPGRAR